MRPTIIRPNAVIDLVFPKTRVRNELEVVRQKGHGHSSTTPAVVSKEITHDYTLKNESYIVNKATKSVTLTLPSVTDIGRTLYVINRSDFQLLLNGNVVSLTGENVTKVHPKCFLQLHFTAPDSWLVLAH